MSHINSEPNAFGLITIKTNFGDMDIELFTQQCPKATRNFVQNCIEGRYISTIFDRVEKDFIAIGGALPGAHLEDEDDYFPDEFHSRLRFNRRGLLATANTSKNKNGAKFFFTLGSTPELQNKHTIFGRVKGNSVYTLIELNDCQVDDDFKPDSEKRILDVIVKENPFPDLLARETKLASHLQRTQYEDSSDSEVDSDEDPLRKRRPDTLKNKKLSFQPESENDSDEESAESETQKVEEITSPKTRDDTATTTEQSEAEKPESHIHETGDLKKETSKPVDREQRLRDIRAQIQRIKQQIERGSDIECLKEEVRTKENPEKNSMSSQTKDGSCTGLKQDRVKVHDERYTMEKVGNFRRQLKEAAKAVGDMEDRSKRRKTDKAEFDSLDDELAALESLDDNSWLRHKFVAKDDLN